MIINKERAKKLWRKLEASKKVGKLQLTEEEFINFIYTINEINCLEEDIYSLNDRPLDKYEIAPEFSDLILPSKISFDAGIRFANLKQGYDKSNIENDFGKSLTPDEFNSISDMIYSGFKRNAEGYKKVSECRCINELYSDYMKRAVCEDKVYEGDAPFFPVWITFPMKSKYANLTVDDMLDEYWTSLVRELSSKK